MSESEDIEKRKLRLVKKFKSICGGCHRKYAPCKGFVFHHTKYIPGEPTYRDFPTSLAYQKFILPIVEKRPEDFELLCKKCHFIIEKWKKFAKEKFRRLAEIRLKSS